MSNPELFSHVWKLLLNGVALKMSYQGRGRGGTPSLRRSLSHIGLSGLIQIRLQSDLRNAVASSPRSDVDPGSAVDSVSRLGFAPMLTWEPDPESSGMRLSVSGEVSLIQSRNVGNDKGRQEANAISSLFSTFVFQFRCFAVSVCTRFI